ncbi:glycosyltransferase family protein [Tichowtungia aerotolerans]|uniref:Glycosyl transferase family 8 n=1 Tax=Tichowtungia aerotolerans TaxID=2697043 RepID=A0A6P1M9P3_9BACT|nr:hypothetical protein [Tichowtungia aerotolerans]QHI70551.1 hypothetical protein GT409_14250 [Tichowtungia aerotolerans]
MRSKTIVTACDRNFAAGAFLMLSSLRRHGVNIPVHILERDLPDADRKLLEQVDGVTLFPASENAMLQHMVYEKYEAVRTAASDLIIWMDSDCIVTGDITPQIDATGAGLQIRMRPENEIAYLFRQRYCVDDQKGKMPRSVLEIWKKDIGERETERISTSCNAHCFVINRSWVGFLERWKNQMLKVIPQETSHIIVNERSPAYPFIDESVISSMLAFCEEAPAITEFQFDRDPAHSVIHFGGSPKPWQRWLQRNLVWFDEIMDNLDWAEQQGWTYPGRPWFLKRKYKTICRMDAWLFERKRLAVHRLRDTARKLLCR